MKTDRLFNDILKYEDDFDRDDIGMIINNNMDIIYENRGAVSEKQWESLIDDIIRWHKIKIKFITNH